MAGGTTWIRFSGMSIDFISAMDGINDFLFGGDFSWGVLTTGGVVLLTSGVVGVTLSALFIFRFLYSSSESFLVIFFGGSGSGGGVLGVGGGVFGLDVSKALGTNRWEVLAEVFNAF